MTGTVKFSAVVGIVLVAAVQFAASEGLLRIRRQAPTLPMSLSTMMTPPRAQARPSVWSCCRKMPMILKDASKAACIVGQPRLPMLMTGSPIPMQGGNPPPGGFPPAGVLPAGVPPGGSPPTGVLPAGVPPGGSPPTGVLPAGVPPAGFLPAGVPPGGSPPTGMTLPPFRPNGVMRGHPGNHSCFIQCAYQNQSLVVGGVLSIEAIKNRITELGTKDPAWGDVYKAAILACTVSPIEIPPNAPCKSGAHEMNNCLNTYALKNCAVGTRNETEVCTGLRQNVVIPTWG